MRMKKDGRVWIQNNAAVVMGKGCDAGMTQLCFREAS